MRMKRNRILGLGSVNIGMIMFVSNRSSIVRGVRMMMMVVNSYRGNSRYIMEIITNNHNFSYH